MPPRWNENRLTAKLGIDYPIIQGPLGGLSSQKLTAAVSNFGGLGSFAAPGVDAIVASGFEAGGHRSSFLRAAEDSLTGTFSLVPQIADMVNVPVIAAGGIADAPGVIAALALGAEAVQMGTVFLACEDSGASPLHRQVLRGKKAEHTALTKGFTGRLARGIHNRLLEKLNREGTAILPYPLQRILVRNPAIPAEEAGRSDLLPLWAGQSANLS